MFAKSEHTGKIAGSNIYTSLCALNNYEILYTGFFFNVS